MDKAWYDEVSVILEDLVKSISLDPATVLLIGAGCRNILHAAFGHKFAARGTTDTDIALALPDWAAFDRINSTYTRSGDTGIRYIIQGHAVDVMPFGGVERPDGITQPYARHQELIVFGFTDVFQRAQPLHLPNGHIIRLPQPAGYGILKMRSWIDRYPDGEYKDAQDLALIAYWYREAPEITNWVYDTDDGRELLYKYQADPETAAVHKLGIDLAGQLSTERKQDLKARWRLTDPDLLARNFTLPAATPHRTSLAQQQRYVRALGTGFLHS